MEDAAGQQESRESRASQDRRDRRKQLDDQRDGIVPADAPRTVGQILAGRGARQLDRRGREPDARPRQNPRLSHELDGRGLPGAYWGQLRVGRGKKSFYFETSCL